MRAWMSSVSGYTVCRVHSLAELTRARDGAAAPKLELDDEQTCVMRPHQLAGEGEGYLQSGTYPSRRALSTPVPEEPEAVEAHQPRREPSWPIPDDDTTELMLPPLAPRAVANDATAPAAR